MKFFRKILKYFLLLLLIFIAWMEILLRVNGNFYTYSEKAEGKYVSYYNAHIQSSYHVYQPGYQVHHNRSEFDYSFIPNSLGLREVELTLGKRDSICTVLFLGDSFTEGVGAPTDSSYPKMFRQYLKEKYALNIHVINAGISGSDPFYCYKLFEDKLLAFEPNMVVIAINGSDITDYIFRGGMERFQPDGSVQFRKGPWWELPYRFFHFVRWYVHDVLKYDRSLVRQEDEAETKQAAITAISRCLDDFDGLCRKNGIECIILIQPFPNEFKSGFAMQEELHVIAQQLDSFHVMNVAIHEQMAKYLTPENAQEYFWPIDGHYDSKGYDVFAHCTAESIKARYPEMFERLNRCN